MKEVKKTNKKTNKIAKKSSNKESINVTEKKISDSTETSVSVFTKTTNPKVIIQSENVDTNNNINKNKNKRKIIKSVCFMIMCIIILISFFLSLKTYNTVNELSHYLIPN